MRLVHRHCLSPTQVVALVDGRMAPLTADALQEHIARCSRCQRRVSEQMDLVRVLESVVGSEPVPSGLHTGIRRRWAWERARDDKARKPIWTWVTIPVVALMLFFGLAIHRDLSGLDSAYAETYSQAYLSDSALLQRELGLVSNYDLGFVDEGEQW